MTSVLLLQDNNLGKCEINSKGKACCTSLPADAFRMGTSQILNEKGKHRAYMSERPHLDEE